MNINKATPSVSVNWVGGPFTGSAFYAGGSVKGVGSPAEALSPLDYKYYTGPVVMGTPLAGAPTAVGMFTVRASYAETQNYNAAFADATITIGAWSLKGFYQPVGETSSILSAPGVQPTVSAATVWNSIKGGQTVPMKFNIYRGVGGTQLTTVADAFTGAGFSAYQLPSCSGGYTEDEIALTDLSTGGTDLRWDGTQFIQNWKTPKVSGADLCYRAVITAKDGSTITAFFKVKK